MSVGQKSDQQVLYQLFLSDNDLPHFHRKKVYKGAFPLNPFIKLLDIHTLHI